MAQLTPVRHHTTSAWIYDCAKKWIICEASDIGRVGTPLWSQLYDDACDVGCETYNPFTQRTTRWYLHDEVKDGEGDLQVTIFRVCSETIRQRPTTEGWELHILND